MAVSSYFFIDRLLKKNQSWSKTSITNRLRSYVASQALLGPALGVGGLTLAGGAAAMGMFNCRGDTPCRVTIQSCTAVRSENVPDCQGLSSSYQDCWEDSLPEFCRIVKHLSSLDEKSQKKLRIICDAI